MNLHLFEKADYLKDKVELVEKGETLIALKVNGRFEVLFFYKGHRLHHSCDCKDGSLNAQKLCAHTIAGILWMNQHLEELQS